MILNRLNELAERERLLDDPAFQNQQIAFAISVSEEGEFLGIGDLRNTIPPKRKGGKPKLDKGKELSVPQPHGSPTVQGFACYFADTLGRVLPVDDDPKSKRSRDTFWEQIDHAIGETDDPALLAIQSFRSKFESDSVLVDRIRQDLDVLKPSPGARCTFAWYPDDGSTITEREPVRQWYRTFFSEYLQQQQAGGPVGVCQITGEIGPLPTTHATRIKLPGGLSSGVALVSNDKDAFKSYLLDGTANASIGYQASEGYTRAINALIAEKLSGGRSCLSVGGVRFLFWTRGQADTSGWTLLDEPDPQEVDHLIGTVRSGKGVSPSTQPNDFYCLCLSPNAARAVVRNYLELPITQAQENIGQWFRDLRIIDPYENQPRANFPLWMVATATVRAGDDLPPHLLPMLMTAALTGAPVPSYVLAACLRRLRVESGPLRFSPARMGLIKLVLNRNPERGVLPMTDQLMSDVSNQSLGYACGRLLAFLARCQSPKDFGAGAQILDRFFGSASTAPRVVFPQLLRLNRHHLHKIRDEMPGFAFNLETELEERLDPFKASPDGSPDFPAVLSLSEQGRFALGFYHQRAAYRSVSAERKAAEQAAEELTVSKE